MGTPQGKNQAAHFVRIFGVDVIFDAFSTRLFPILWTYLDQITQCGLIDILAPQIVGTHRRRAVQHLNLPR